MLETFVSIIVVYLIIKLGAETNYQNKQTLEIHWLQDDISEQAIKRIFKY